MLTAPHLALLASTYSEARETTLAALGKTIFNDHRFFKRLVAGADCTTQSAVKAADWFMSNWPDDAAWPDGVPRPQQEDVAA